MARKISKERKFINWRIRSRFLCGKPLKNT
jgi:hypothetical protein